VSTRPVAMSNRSSDRKAVICIFAKPPRPGEVKTRLVPLLGAERAAALAEAFLQDTVAMVRQCSWAECVIAATQPLERDYFSQKGLWLQGDGDLGMRLERIFQRGLRRHEMVFALGADSPGMPCGYLQEAMGALHTADAVLGPASDGGFCFLGLKKCPAGIFDGITWSSPETMASTMRALQAHGLRVTVGQPWFDVDTPEDLEHLREVLQKTPTAAPVTAELLRGWK
jgi:rSAM/selenodomain-associated transferase 1